MQEEQFFLTSLSQGKEAYDGEEQGKWNMLPQRWWNTLLQFQKSPSVVDKKPPDVAITVGPNLCPGGRLELWLVKTFWWTGRLALSP